MNNSHKTAITRNKLSSPARYLYQNNLLKGRCLDYGCGKGKDTEELGHKGIDITGYDPYYAPYGLVGKYDTIMCNFVLNVIEDTKERNEVIRHIKELLSYNGVAYVSVRNDKSNLNGLTKIGTWQGYIELDYEVVKRTSTFVMYKVTKCIN